MRHYCSSHQLSLQSAMLIPAACPCEQFSAHPNSVAGHALHGPVKLPRRDRDGARHTGTKISCACLGEHEESCLNDASVRILWLAGTKQRRDQIIMIFSKYRQARETRTIAIAHFGGNDEFPLSAHRLYMVGGSDEESDTEPYEPKGDECWEQVRRIYSLGHLRMIQASTRYLYAYKTDCVVVIRAEDGKIAMSDCDNLEPGTEYRLKWDYYEAFTPKGLFLEMTYTI